MQDLTTPGLFIAVEALSMLPGLDAYTLSAELRSCKLRLCCAHVTTDPWLSAGPVIAGVCWTTSWMLMDIMPEKEAHVWMMHLQGQHSAAAAAEQLVAEQASEAAQAAAKKVKKQNEWKLILQVPSASEPPAGASMQPQQIVEPIAPLHQRSPSGSKCAGESDTAGLQTQPQHLAVHNSAMRTLPAPTLLDEHVSASDAAADEYFAGNPAIDASRGADPTFLDQLFCCPITKVPPPPQSLLPYASLHSCYVKVCIALYFCA